MSTKIRENMELTNSNGLGFLALAPVDDLAIETSSSLGPPSSLRFSSSLSCCNFRRALDDILGFKKTKFIKSSGVLVFCLLNYFIIVENVGTLNNYFKAL